MVESKSMDMSKREDEGKGDNEETMRASRTSLLSHCCVVGCAKTRVRATTKMVP